MLCIVGTRPLRGVVVLCIVGTCQRRGVMVFCTARTRPLQTCSCILSLPYD